jgi:DNA-binding transcriptional ArsR family regulator
MLEITCYDTEMSEWSFLTNHARVLLCIADDPGVRLRDIGTALDITERSAYAIVNDLTEAGYVLKERDGRRNRYIVQHHLPIPETTVRERTVGEVLELLIGRKPRTRTASAQKATRSVRARAVTKRAKSTTKRK